MGTQSTPTRHTTTPPTSPSLKRRNNPPPPTPAYLHPELYKISPQFARSMAKHMASGPQNLLYRNRIQRPEGAPLGVLPKD